MRGLMAELKELRLHGMAHVWEELAAQERPRKRSQKWLLKHLLKQEQADRALRSVNQQMNMVLLYQQILMWLPKGRVDLHISLFPELFEACPSSATCPSFSDNNLAFCILFSSVVHDRNLIQNMDRAAGMTARTSHSVGYLQPGEVPLGLMLARPPRCQTCLTSLTHSKKSGGSAP
jgi:hypothetical protein